MRRLAYLMLITLLLMVSMSSPGDVKPLKIGEVKFKKLSGNVIAVEVQLIATGFEGELVYRCIVEFFRGSEVAYLGFAEGSIRGWEVKVIELGFNFSSAPEDYRVKVFVWSGWPGEPGFKILADSMELAFKVEG
ncbi:MAG TPA: hypothetical protein ENF87_03330 [Thermoproteales archaeon]|nr:hypothetical protein [Thermoproteales archaeon]